MSGRLAKRPHAFAVLVGGAGLILGKGWQRMLGNYFDHHACFYRASHEQDETGQFMQMFSKVKRLKAVPCAVGDARRDQSTVLPLGSDPIESPTALLVAGVLEVKVGWRVVLDKNRDTWYKVVGVTPSQSADVTEIRIERL